MPSPRRTPPSALRRAIPRRSARQTPSGRARLPPRRAPEPAATPTWLASRLGSAEGHPKLAASTSPHPYWRTHATPIDRRTIRKRQRHPTPAAETCSTAAAGVPRAPATPLPRVMSTTKPPRSGHAAAWAVAESAHSGSFPLSPAEARARPKAGCRDRGATSLQQRSSVILVALAALRSTETRAASQLPPACLVAVCRLAATWRSVDDTASGGAMCLRSSLFAPSAVWRLSRRSCLPGF